MKNCRWCKTKIDVDAKLCCECGKYQGMNFAEGCGFMMIMFVVWVFILLNQ